MTTFRQYHDDNLRFYNETKINFCQCDIHSRINFSELLRITTDTAVEDYRQRGLSYEFLSDHHVGILLSRLSFRFHQIPKVNDVITISTWEEKPEMLQLMRAYEITRQDPALCYKIALQQPNLRTYCMHLSGICRQHM